MDRHDHGITLSTMDDFLTANYSDKLWKYSMYISLWGECPDVKPTLIDVKELEN